jgi:Dolichyl-phosphate-mannose-protein mannosyltransferase
VKPRIHAGDVVTAGVALAARVISLLWAGGRFSPVADGIYYHPIAARIAEGLGSTWLWPDGTVTYAAHYPVGYPALVALAYRLVGPWPTAGGVVNALLGTGAAVAVYRLALRATQPRWALLAGLAVALHPGLVMYTPALMTEGVTAALLAMAAWMVSYRSRAGVVLLGLAVGLATLVRPQSLLLAPCLGLLGARPDAPRWARLRCAAAATAIALLVCAPWTIRNCLHMRKCALVSFNGGWNLLIGAGEKSTGAWAPVDVPEACRTVWDEAEKDACFGREARRIIEQAPARWIGLVPARLAATFDYAGAPGFYLHESNPAVFDVEAKRRLGVVETIYERLAYLGALVAVALARGPMQRARLWVSGSSALFLFGLHACVAVLGLAVSLALRGKRLFEGPVLWGATFFAIVSTAAVHAVFFGSGRYSMVVFPLVTGLAFAWPVRPFESAANDHDRDRDHDHDRERDGRQ